MKYTVNYTYYLDCMNSNQSKFLKDCLLHFSQFLPESVREEIKIRQYCLFQWLKDNAENLIQRNDFAHTNRPFHVVWCIHSTFGMARSCHNQIPEVSGLRLQLIETLNAALSLTKVAKKRRMQ